MRVTVMLAATALAGLFATGLSTVAFAAGDGDALQYFTKEQAFATVSKPKPDGSATSNIISQHDAFSEQIVQRTVSGKVETHELWTDYMVVVDGNATITIGGTVKGNAKNPNGQVGEWLGASSTGGKVYDLKPGVVLIIPKGVPHWMQLPANGKLHYVAFKRKG
jgi:mannose-6-phosphate isomerase-like protein (cupin superfamily)